jgi:Cell Wall Hydrolase
MKRWPRTIPGVILQHAQFSSFSAGDPNAVLFPLPPASAAQPSPDWIAWGNAQIAVNTDLGGDPTNGATNYESLPEGAPRPAWADPTKLTATIGPFRFYKL